MHRDLKTSNLLYSNKQLDTETINEQSIHVKATTIGEEAAEVKVKGFGAQLKICDFGLARTFRKSQGQDADREKRQQLTNWVVTLWYRAPELLLGENRYTEAVDMWSVACIMAELILREPLFAGKSEMEQLHQIFKVLGNPSEENWPGWSSLKVASKLPP